MVDSWCDVIDDYHLRTALGRTGSLDILDDLGEDVSVDPAEDIKAESVSAELRDDGHDFSLTGSANRLGAIRRAMLVQYRASAMNRSSNCEKLLVAATGDTTNNDNDERHSTANKELRTYETYNTGPKISLGVQGRLVQRRQLATNVLIVLIVIPWAPEPSPFARGTMVRMV
ncbi:hypothetical protein FHL15_000916 [Xylaria flabelliformis]|uniref:Uncharacterized protein n=1 Tax=Xylaria flabelliformis TaxID=2512241 RepID=A0A553IDK3_9PEZI|nr:hypothetical protein FHL15_000916 [Xylaria flabelliformis]